VKHIQLKRINYANLADAYFSKNNLTTDLTSLNMSD
jgi:hypothetical protein